MFPDFDREPRAPAHPVPPKSCDTHMHVFGEARTYPFQVSNPPYSLPIAAGMSEYLTMRSVLGFERTVLVSPSPYGTNYALLKDTLRRYGASANLRGVALVDDTTSDADLAELDRLGVRGARFLFRGDFGVRPDLGVFRRSLDRIAELGWIAKVFCAPQDLLDLADELRKIKLTTVIDHMGRLIPNDPVSVRAYDIVMELLRAENWWVQLSNGDRSSPSAPPWRDVIPYARAMYDAAPDRCIWGTDWPHTQYDKPVVPNDGALVDLLDSFLPDDEARSKVFSRNPGRLFGFD